MNNIVLKQKQVTLSPSAHCSGWNFRAEANRHTVQVKIITGILLFPLMRTQRGEVTAMASSAVKQDAALSLDIDQFWQENILNNVFVSLVLILALLC